jgi:type I restriction enzyme S subunit
VSRIENLVKQLCPGGVPVTTLGDIGTFVRGGGMQKADLVDDGFPAIHYGQIHTYYGTSATKTLSFVTQEFAGRLRKAEPGDLVIATTSEDDEAVGKAVAWLGDTAAAISGDAYIYRHSLVPKYVAYYFQSQQFREQKKRAITGTKVRRISGEALAKIRVPAPPVEVQEEIVRTLDLFRSLEAELEGQLGAELDARHTQYAHYRDALFNFPETGQVRLLPMGEVGQFIRGRRFTKNDVVDVGIPSIHYGEIYTHYGTATSTALSDVRENLRGQLRFAQPGDVVIAAVGETVEDVGKGVAWLGNEPVAIHDDCFLFRHALNPKFVSYYLQTEAFHLQKARHVARAKVKRLSAEGLAKLTMPIPPLAQQERIVAILDAYEKVLADLSVSLPAERSVRSKQYEHYRDRLLTFEEAGVFAEAVA